MSEKEMTGKETLRDSARGILDVLSRIDSNMGLLVGEVPREPREDVDPNGAVDELWVSLNDIRYFANRIEQASDKVAEQV